jgi:predicted dinucleotide-binding enzyme
MKRIGISGYGRFGQGLVDKGAEAGNFPARGIGT